MDRKTDLDRADRVRAITIRDYDPAAHQEPAGRQPGFWLIPSWELRRLPRR